MYEQYLLKLIIFDVDGTLSPNRAKTSDNFPNTLMPGVYETCRDLHESGVTLAIATNQGGLRKGTLALSEVHRHLDVLCKSLHISAYRIASGINPWLKKPNGGMIEQLCRFYDVDKKHVLFVGDSEDDRKAAEAAGVSFQEAKYFFGWEGPDVPL